MNYDIPLFMSYAELIRTFVMAFSVILFILEISTCCYKCCKFCKRRTQRRRRFLLGRHYDEDSSDTESDENEAPVVDAGADFVYFPNRGFITPCAAELPPAYIEC